MCERFCFGKTNGSLPKYSAGKRKLLYVSKMSHGYGAMHIPSQWTGFRAQWAYRLSLPEPAKWKNYTLAGLDTNKNNWHLGARARAIFSSIPPAHFSLSPAWKAIISTTRTLGFTPAAPTIENVLHQPLFFNPQLDRNFCTPSWASFTRAGIISVGDIFTVVLGPGRDMILVRLSPARIIAKFRNANISAATISDGVITTRYNMIVANYPHTFATLIDVYRSYGNRDACPFPPASFYCTANAPNDVHVLIPIPTNPKIEPPPPPTLELYALSPTGELICTNSPRHS
jgi:hypothetical protein